ncbi:MAG: hypothetical protein ABI358_05275 [Ginsengibacter sp.]
MPAYSFEDLYNKFAGKEAAEALRTFCISKNSHDKILEKYPAKLYTPNYFIRIALGLLTFVAVLFSGLLLWLLTSASSTGSISTLLITLAILCYIALELLVKKKKYYNAGVDNVLMTFIIIFIGSTFAFQDFEVSWLLISGVIMVISLWLATRFTDGFMAVISYSSLLIFIFRLYLLAGNIAMLTAPFLIMAASVFIYLLMKKLIKSKIFSYRFCFKCVLFLTLITFYGSSNYFVVKELSSELFQRQISDSNSLPLGWFFWLMTFIIPPAYIIFGIIKKDFLVMRTGLALIAATIFTIKYYYAFWPIELEMITMAIIFIASAYLLIRYLKDGKFGFTSLNLYAANNGILNAEALIIAQTFNEQPTANNAGLYNGGSGGGGVASGDF